MHIPRVTAGGRSEIGYDDMRTACKSTQTVESLNLTDLGL